MPRTLRKHHYSRLLPGRTVRPSYRQCLMLLDLLMRLALSQARGRPDQGSYLGIPEWSELSDVFGFPWHRTACTHAFALIPLLAGCTRFNSAPLSGEGDAGLARVWSSLAVWTPDSLFPVLPWLWCPNPAQPRCVPLSGLTPLPRSPFRHALRSHFYTLHHMAGVMDAGLRRAWVWPPQLAKNRL
jgi:hypothetical protein